MPPDPANGAPRGRSRWERFVRTAWWLHSAWALAFGVGVMLYARRGLAHADKLLVALAASWFVVFVALRMTVGPDGGGGRLLRRGLRLTTHYFVKNLYQQMLFFLVPLYASSTTWSASSRNWWLAPLLLAFAVLSTMDLVMDRVVLRRRLLAAVMYAACMFGVLNLVLPVALALSHFEALIVAAAAAAPAVALLTFRVRQIASVAGLALVVGAAGGMAVAAFHAVAYVPPAPLALAEGAVGHGTPGSYEIVPGHARTIPANQLDGLRCVTRLTEPGGVRDPIVHVWVHRGRVVRRAEPERVAAAGPGVVFRSYLMSLPDDPLGPWACRVETDAGQLVGERAFEVVPATAP
ncbi:MAG: DUF2914 domain-containing protein [Deltaproteobacteria bacterium]|nr:MAG: DUF2914 domain-containing protein [Deltaproteobacteria bacterium]